MALAYTNQDWFIFIQDPENVDKYDPVVIRGPVPTQILQQRLKQILEGKSLQTAVFFYEVIKVIIFQRPLSVEQLRILQGDSS